MSEPSLPLPVEHLPKSVAELVRVVGAQAALEIVEARGGITLYVPMRADPEHWLAALIGIEAFRALVEYYNGDEIEIPRCVAALRALREREIAAQWVDGRSNAQLARAYGYTERGIRKLVRRLGIELDDRQGDLF